MKKSVLKLMAMALVILLMLSTMSIAAFAAEADDVTPCVACTHPYMMVRETYSFANAGDSGHYVHYYDWYTCADCGYDYSIYINTEWEAHTLPCTKCGNNG